MARLNFREIDRANSADGDSDQFEKFARLFFESVIGEKVIKGPTRGADGGIDLCLESTEHVEPVRKLVSCKHFAYSNTSVGIGHEQDILDRLAGFGCTEFVGFYSTIVSDDLQRKLERLRDQRGINFRLYDSEQIEDLLLKSLAGFRLAKRFFPKSIQNAWPRIITLDQAYTDRDAVRLESGHWIVPAAYRADDRVALLSNMEAALRHANERAMCEIHAPMFLAAWKDAAKYYPGFFMVPNEGIDSAISPEELPPNWDAVHALDEMKANLRWSLLAIWSLVAPFKVEGILKEMGYHSSQQKNDFMSFQWLAFSTGTERRDILARLFAYHSIVPMRGS